ncbi:MAG: hypothetical protein ACOC6E_02225 [Thermodesulfobacteriota bacterium]
MYWDEHIVEQARIEVNQEVLDKFFKEVLHGTISDFAFDKRLPYSLIYNLANGRIRSLSARDYRIIFGEEPLPGVHERVDGAYFRGMVHLWLYVHDGAAKSDLYREFYPDKGSIRVDYRIFNGQVRTVEARLERIMEKKFQDQGFDSSEVKRGIQELDQATEEQRVPYICIRPVLKYLEEYLKVSPSQLLYGRYQRYERGELQTVSKKVYHNALKLKQETEKALSAGSKAKMQQLRERIYGKRKGFTLYAELEEQIKFLQTYERKSPKRYLGRTIRNYEESKLKRVASWRARKIRNACKELINNNPEIPIQSLPREHRIQRLERFLFLIKAFLVDRMNKSEGIAYEKSILQPRLDEHVEWEGEEASLTSMERAPDRLGMSKSAFDMMVANNRELFRRIGHYDGRWHLSTRYLEELSEKQGFGVVKEKYEFMAKMCGKPPSSAETASNKAPEPTGKPSRQGTGRVYAEARKPGLQGQGGFRYPWQEVFPPESYNQELYSCIPSRDRYEVNAPWLLHLTTLAAQKHVMENMKLKN